MEGGHHTDTIWAEACLHAVSLSVGGMLLLDILINQPGSPDQRKQRVAASHDRPFLQDGACFGFAWQGFPSRFWIPAKTEAKTP